MQFGRIGEPGDEVPVAFDGSRVVDISHLIGDITPQTLPRLRHLRIPDDCPEILPSRFGPPIRGVGKIVCVGVNYREHAAEAGMEVTDELPLFLKAADTLVGPNDPVIIPPGSNATDYEVELAIVIGHTARYLSDDEDPLGHVAGYTISNDVSERVFQLERGGQWDKGKNCETFNPLGPWLTMPDQLDVDNLTLSCSVNGDLRQDSSTSMMVRSVADLIRYISQFMTLYPGDIVNSGTPGGVALGFPDPKPYLCPGDQVELRIEHLGTQRQTFVAFESALQNV